MDNDDYAGKNNRCCIHGTHDDWYQHPGQGPDKVCAKCHPKISLRPIPPEVIAIRRLPAPWKRDRRSLEDFEEIDCG